MSGDERRIIARAIARSGIHYKRSSLLSGVIALALCPLVLVVDETAPKAVLLAAAVLLAVVTYRSIRTSQLHFDPESSPVLALIARAPEQIARVSCQRPKPAGPWLVTVADGADHRLTMRVPAEVGEEEVAALLAALAALAPQAEQEPGPLAGRTPPSEG